MFITIFLTKLSEVKNIAQLFLLPCPLAYNCNNVEKKIKVKQLTNYYSSLGFHTYKTLNDNELLMTKYIA